MIMSVDETQRIVRMKSRSLIKRIMRIAWITAVHSLAQLPSMASELALQLLVAVENLDSLWTDFVIEDNSVLESLCDLNLSAEYYGKSSVEVRGLIIYSKSIDNSYNRPTSREYEDKASVRRAA